MTDWEPMLIFDRQGDEVTPFALGFECGRLWEIAKANAEEFSRTLDVENAEMALRIAERLERPLRSEEVGDEWIKVTFGAAA